ncbi:MAG: helix-turn-helix domain-containing protein [Pseudonocardia sp.]|nr:helix-turn-helix domain-containing protein [Pseudonocardia sp.]
MTTGPTMRKRQLGSQLRRLRTDAGVSSEVAAAELDCARSKISHMETGRNAPRKPELKALLELYGAPADAYATLEALRIESGERGWWSTFKLPNWFSVYVGLEADASTMWSFAGETIPGLMQTIDYNRSTHQATPHLAKPGEVDRLVEARRRRSLRLSTAPLLDYRAVISEAAVRRAVGLGEVGAAQLEHLIKLAEQENVGLQILPLAAGLHASLGGSFVLLDFGGVDVAPPTAFQEFATSGEVADDQEIVASLTAAWNLLHEQALSEDDSLSWLRRVAGE